MITRVVLLLSVVLAVTGCARRRLFDESIIHGSVAPGFEEMREAFIENFRERNELGAAVCVYHRGVKVVDLWGGYRDAKTDDPWNEDTMVLVFSASKGVSALVLAQANSRGYFDLDTPVAHYWPEFAQEDKQDITVRQLLAHQAGLSALDVRMSPERMADLDELAVTLARQKPAWEPGVHHGYHAITLGWYENELLRRVDPQHRSIGRVLQEDVAAPLDIEMYIGLPDDVPSSRIANLDGYHPLEMLGHLDELNAALFFASAWPWSLSSRSLTYLEVGALADIDDPEYRAVEFPSANCITSARALARLYSVFATGGEALDISTETFAELTAPPRVPTEGDYDLVMKQERAYSYGMFKPHPVFPFGTDHTAFGSAGAGGAHGYADPTRQIGYGYVMNRLGYDVIGDERDAALRAALHRCLDRLDNRPADARSTSASATTGDRGRLPVSRNSVSP